MSNEYCALITNLFKEPKFKNLENFLIKNSTVSNDKFNIGLSDGFADYFNNNTITPDNWKLLCKWSAIDYGQAPTDSKEEFLPFCAIKGFGEFYTYGSVKEQRYILSVFQSAMNDRRWRIREAVTMAFQRIARNNFFSIKKIINKFYPDSNLLEKRAFITSLADPVILKKESNVIFCLDLSEKILKEIMILTPKELNSIEFKILSKSLESILSIFVAYLPNEGFEMLKKFSIVSGDEKDISRILKSNLGKVILHKNYGDEVTEVFRLMNQ
ncbi:hypothetical protein [Clostridium sp. LP20]|uniref:hypothetical protein n=1 Tax=Clostridium sp. LP20 TaxID=3418665 RepID=UPI003EE774EA